MEDTNPLIDIYKGLPTTFNFKIHPKVAAEDLIKSYGYDIPLDEAVQQRVHTFAHDYWLNNFDEDLIPLSWIYGYTYILNIPIKMTKKRDIYSSVEEIIS